MLPRHPRERVSAVYCWQHFARASSWGLKDETNLRCPRSIHRKAMPGACRTWSDALSSSRWPFDGPTHPGRKEAHQRRPEAPLGGLPVVGRVESGLDQAFPATQSSYDAIAKEGTGRPASMVAQHTIRRDVGRTRVGEGTGVVAVVANQPIIPGISCNQNTRSHDA